MTNILLLLKVQLYSTFSLNDLRKGRGLGKYFKLGQVGAGKFDSSLYDCLG